MFTRRFLTKRVLRKTPKNIRLITNHPLKTLNLKIEIKLPERKESVTMFTSSAHIKSLLIQNPQDYPNIGSADSFLEELKAWQNYKTRVDAYHSFCSSIAHLIEDKTPEQTYHTPIRPYLDAIHQAFSHEGRGVYTPEALGIMEKVWNSIEDKQVFISRPEWIYNNDITKCEHNELKPSLKEWDAVMGEKWISMYPVFRVLGEFAKLGVGYLAVTSLVKEEASMLPLPF